MSHDTLETAAVLTSCQFSISSGTASESLTLTPEGAASSPVDGTIHPSPSQQGAVGSIDYGINLQSSDVTLPQGYLPVEDHIHTVL